ncbi:flavodoxin [Weissella diestrammenae]|uniref:Flavodoxin n=1 Tax=Weissella diestrammenae TaxID=1162633 RepID=A0A7G9T467_9LACO|nr:flavodoxin [Weissella diestrammenae]MCM0583416.1 flavodoxin [Weissella diestrammenae]QNN74892.1 flavodoxin [Weissella diestrammenae]
MNARVLYATLTGNNEDVADIIIDELQHLGVTTTKEEIMDVDALDINPTETDIVVSVVYTFDKGSLADEALDFYEDLSQVDLSGLVYGVAGSGDTFYGDDFGVAVDKMGAKFALTGAIEGAAGVKVNLSPNDAAEVELRQFAQALVKAAQ